MKRGKTQYDKHEIVDRKHLVYKAVNNFICIFVTLFLFQQRNDIINNASREQKANVRRY